MKILVTGGTGYIGSHTCVELLKRGMDVVVVDNLVNSSMESMKRVQAITGKTPVFYDLDVRDEEKLSRIFEEHHIDCAIHFAGLKAVGESVEKPALYYDNNLNSTITLCRVMAKYGVKRIIFSSSATVYSGDNEMPLTENSKTATARIPMAGPSISASRSCGILPRPIRSGAWCCCATSTRLAPMRAEPSERTPRAFPTT